MLTDTILDQICHCNRQLGFLKVYQLNQSTGRDSHLKAKEFPTFGILIAQKYCRELQYMADRLLNNSSMAINPLNNCSNRRIVAEGVQQFSGGLTTASPVAACFSINVAPFQHCMILTRRSPRLHVGHYHHTTTTICIKQTFQ